MKPLSYVKPLPPGPYAYVKQAPFLYLGSHNIYRAGQPAAYPAGGVPWVAACVDITGGTTSVWLLLKIPSYRAW